MNTISLAFTLFSKQKYEQFIFHGWLERFTAELTDLLRWCYGRRCDILPKSMIHEISPTGCCKEEGKERYADGIQEKIWLFLPKEVKSALLGNTLLGAGPNLPLTSCQTIGMLLKVTKPLFLCIKEEDTNIYLIVFLWWFNKIIKFFFYLEDAHKQFLNQRK